jgi:hypothetical protein
MKLKIFILSLLVIINTIVSLIYPQIIFPLIVLLVGIYLIYQEYKMYKFKLLIISSIESLEKYREEFEKITSDVNILYKNQAILKNTLQTLQNMKNAKRR